MTELEKQITEKILSRKLLIRKAGTGWLLTENLPEDDIPAVADTHKDRLFRMLFEDRRG